MVNLFITVIITSKDKLRQSVLEENLFYMAQSSRMIQYFHKLFQRTNSLTNFNVEGKNTFCVHKFVDQNAQLQKVPYNIQDIEERLRNLVSEKIESEMFLMTFYHPL